MPATQQQSPASPSYPTSVSEALLVAGLILFILGTFVCIRRRQVQTRAAHTRGARERPLSAVPSKPLCHDVYIRADAEGEGTWGSIQPLAVQTPLRRPELKYGGSRWPSIKSRASSSFFSSDASLNTATLLDDGQMPVDAHLDITVLIAMPFSPPGSDDAPDADIAFGVAQTRTS
ncbi:hypothetical protein FB451DRAFT_781095 [Mycena latifolia]|nr:hypothetical protein FB451DRAFT_781095 [Mycena latifolia]